MSDPIPPPEQGYFIDPAGYVVAVSRQDIPVYSRAEGYSPASPKQINEFTQQQKYGGLGSQIAAGAEGLASGLTLGASTATETGLGNVLGIPALQAPAVAGREEVNPGTSLAGNVIGTALPLVLTGGAATPEELEARVALRAAKAVPTGIAEGAALPADVLAARQAAAASAAGPTAVQSAALYTGPSLAARLGEAAQGYAGDALQGLGGSGRLAQAAQAVIPYAARGAAEMLPYAAGNVVHEDALGDEHATAGNILAQVGIGAMLGGTLGGALGLGSKLTTDVIPAAKEALSNFTDRWAPKVMSVASGLPEQSIRDAIASRWDVIHDPAERIAIAENVSDGLNDVKSKTDDALTALHKEVKPAAFSQFLETVDPKIAYAEAQRVYDSINDTIQTLRAEPDLYEAANARGLEGIRDGIKRDILDQATIFRSAQSPGIEGDIDVVRQPGGKRIFVDRATGHVMPRQSGIELPEDLDAKAIFDRLEEAKRLTYEESKTPALASRSQTNTGLAVGRLFGNMKSGLTNPDIWGEAGSTLARINDAQSEWYDARTSLMKELGKSIGKEWDGNEKDFVMNPNKINSWLNQAADIRGQFRSDAMDRFLQASRNLTGEIETVQQRAPMTLNAFDKAALDGLVTKTGDIVQNARTRASATELIRQMSPSSGWNTAPVANAIHGGLGVAAESLLGGEVAGPVGAIAGALHGVYRVASDVPRAIGVLTTLERLNNSVQGKIETGVKGLIKGSAPLTGPLRSEVLAGVPKAFGEDHKEAAERYQKETEQIMQLSNDPQVSLASLTAMTHSIAPHAPKTAQALQNQAVRSIQFLRSKIQPMPPKAMFGPKPVPQLRQMFQWQRYRTALEAPAALPRLAQAGRLTPEHVEAVQAVAPQLLASMQSEVVSQIMKHGNPPPAMWGQITTLMGGQNLFRAPTKQNPQVVYASSQPPVPTNGSQTPARGRKLPDNAPKIAFNTHATGAQRLSGADALG